MDVDEDDDFYAPEDSTQINSEKQPEIAAEYETKAKQEDEDLEEGEEEDEGEDDGSDSDIDIIVDRKEGSKPAPVTQPKYNEIRNIPQRTGANDTAAKLPAVKKEHKDTPTTSSADLPGISTSKIDVDAKPIYQPAGKPITQVNIDEDLNENEKPWRRPGTDVSDYFNYGFDEFTWALYASKQESLRSEFSQDKIGMNTTKMFEEMQMMMGMGGVPGMPGMAAGTGGAQMEGMPPEMQAMMQQMMASGMDPTQMAGGAGGAGAGSQNQAFGGQGFGQGQNAYGYDQQQQGGGNRGGNFGRGRGRRGNW